MAKATALTKTAVYKACLIDNKMAERINKVDAEIVMQKRKIDLCVKGVFTSMLIHGGPGVGKTHLIMDAMERAGLEQGVDFVIYRGTTSPIMLYRLLWELNRPNAYVIIDDCDAILRDENGINVLKAVMDDKCRTVSWNTKSEIKTLDGTGIVPKTFDFKGTVVVCTNIDYQRRSTGKMADHFAAILSRTEQMQIDYKTKDAQFAYVAHLVVNVDYLEQMSKTAGLTAQQKIDLLKFIMTNRSKYTRIDARVPEKLARIMKAEPQDWQMLAESSFNPDEA
jgi:hypothetical protein